MQCRTWHLQKTISCDRSSVHSDWWIFDLGITWGWPAALMRSHLPLLGARSAAATVQLQSMSPRGWLMSVTEQKDKKQMRLLCAGTETGTEFLLLQYKVIFWIKKKVYLHCCSKQGHPGVRGDDGGDSFLWAVILGDYRDSQVITKYPSTLHVPWTIQSQMSVLIPKSHGFTTKENCSTTFLEDTSAVTYQWRKKCTGQ